jgi:hypothetical protein
MQRFISYMRVFMPFHLKIIESLLNFINKKSVKSNPICSTVELS